MSENGDVIHRSKHLDSSSRPVVLVTGAASGVGAATVKLLAQDYFVWALDRDAAGLSQFAGNAQVDCLNVDVSDESQINDAVNLIAAESGRLDGVVANAGMCFTASAEHTSAAMWDEIMSVDLRAVFLLARAVIPHLRLSPRGAFVATASELAIFAQPGLSAYASAKAGVVNLMRVLALENALAGTRFNSVAPGPVLTPMLDSHQQARGEALDDVAATIPMGRIARPEEIATVIRFLLGSDSSFITGSVIVADGGITAL